MKTKAHVRLLMLLVLTLAFSLQPSALLQASPLGTAFTYQGRLNSGTNAANGSYDLRFILYDADAGAMGGGNFTLEGGFWGIIAALQTPGAPLLSILRTTTNTVAVSWPSPSTGWTLQQNTNSVSSVNWSNMTATIQDDGTTKTLIVNPPAGNRFYRLHKP
jgi:hypothetical protein